MLLYKYDIARAGGGIMLERKVLIVDDQKQIREIMETALKNEGFAPRLSESGEEALKILEKENIPVLFLDIHLPGMNGIYLCKRIKREWPEKICCAMTGYNTAFELKECLDAGFDNYFTKPLSLEKIIKIVNDSFDKLENK